MKQKTSSGEARPDNGKTQINVAQIGLISAVTVAVVGLIGVVVSNYFSSQSTQKSLQTIIQATQTAEAKLTFTASPTPLQTRATFDYFVRVQSKRTGQSLPSAKVTIEVTGQAPLIETADTTGLARIFIDTNRVSQPAKLIVQMSGYEQFILNIDLRRDMLPTTIQLEDSASPPLSTGSTVPQQVRWAPVDGLDAGICINTCDNFLPWPKLQIEVQQKLLPQVGNAPAGSTIRLQDLGGRTNWTVQIIGPSGNQIGYIWFGPDPFNNWAFDGLIRVGTATNPPQVWDTFQRYSDGSYRKR